MRIHLAVTRAACEKGMSRDGWSECLIDEFDLDRWILGCELNI